jgi:anti-anti-sigma factor
MQVEKDEVGGATVLRPSGRIDSTTSTVLEQAFGLGDGIAPRLLVDLAGVDYLSSAGLRVVFVAAKAAKAAGSVFVLFGLAPAVLSVFEMSGFDRLVTIAGTEAEALAVSAG